MHWTSLCLASVFAIPTSAFAQSALDGKDLLCEILGRVKPKDFDSQTYNLLRFSSAGEGSITVSKEYVDWEIETHQLGFTYNKVTGIKKYEITYRVEDFPNTIIFGDMRHNVLPGLGEFKDFGFEEAIISVESLAQSVKIGIALKAEFKGSVFRIDRENLLLESVDSYGNLGFKYSCSLLPLGDAEPTLKNMEAEAREFYEGEFEELLLQHSPTENKL